MSEPKPLSPRTKKDNPEQVIDPLTRGEPGDGDEGPVDLEAVPEHQLAMYVESPKQRDDLAFYRDDLAGEWEPDHDEDEFETDCDEDEFEPDYGQDDDHGTRPKLAPGPKHGPGHHAGPPHEHGPGPKGPGKRAPGKKVPGKKAHGPKKHPGHPPPSSHEHGPGHPPHGPDHRPPPPLHEHGPGHGPGGPRPEPDFSLGPDAGFGVALGPGFGFDVGLRDRGRRRGQGSGRRGRPGDVRAAILRLVAERPMHGYEMIQQIAERSHGAWRPSPGSVYPTLQLLDDEGLIVGSKSGGSKKLFELTDDGRAEAAKVTTAPWEQFAAGVDARQVNVREAVNQLLGAVAQAAYVATVEQQQRVVTILKNARRQIYTLLADSD